ELAVGFELLAVFGLLRNRADHVRGQPRYIEMPQHKKLHRISPGAARQYFNHNRGFVTEIMCDMNAAVRSLGHSAMAAQHRTSYEHTGSSELWQRRLARRFARKITRPLEKEPSPSPWR